ncbi:MAG: hypothetical protein U0166_05100 [Acidobacteriota bacterium]
MKLIQFVTCEGTDARTTAEVWIDPASVALVMPASIGDPEEGQVPGSRMVLTTKHVLFVLDTPAAIAKKLNATNR